MNHSKTLLSCLLSTGFLFLFLHPVFAQEKMRLNKKISLSIHQKPLSHVLTEIGRKGSFTFSYNTNILPGDSLVSIQVSGIPVREVLEKLLGGNFSYVESGKYVIILQKATSPPAKIYMVTGYVHDKETREKISNASVYESDQLVSVLTDTNGFFRLRLRDKYAAHSTIIISKQFYRDTLLMVQSGVDQQVTVGIGHDSVATLQPFVVSNRVEKTWLGKWMLSSKEKIQSLNIMDFFAKKPFQVSLTPLLGTHGRMSGQVVNKFSCNIVGGYTMGINGFEMAGVFNIDKKDVRSVQIAGVLNLVGGHVSGVQLSGIHNLVMDSVSGVQIAGANNMVMGTFRGVQLSGVTNVVGRKFKGVEIGGVLNIAKDSVKGLQLSGVINRVYKDMNGWQVACVMNKTAETTHGFQFAGVANFSRKEMHGLQLSTVLNYTRNLKGVQIGLVNIADTSSGYMIGLVNIVKHGMHRFSLSANEMAPYNIAYKFGTERMYSIVQFGFNPANNEKVWMLDYGIGYRFRLSSAFSLAPELTQKNVFVGTWKKIPQAYRLQLISTVKLGKVISLYAGPAISVYDPTEYKPGEGYKTALPSAGYQTFGVGSMRGWIGWTAGINFF